MIEVQKVAKLTPNNLKALLADMGLQPGIHPAGQLYDAYTAMCDEAGAQPISKKAFGVSLANQGCTPVTRQVAGKRSRCWMIPRSRFRDLVARDPQPEFSMDSQHPTLDNPS